MPDHVLKLPATFEAYSGAAGALRRLLDAHGIGLRPRYNIELVFEEIVSNIIRHGCSGNIQCAIEVVLRFDENTIAMSFHDNGPPFDPRSYLLPELPRTLETASNGGLGLLLVAKAAQRIDYERTLQGRNHLTITIALAGSASTASS